VVLDSPETYTGHARRQAFAAALAGMGQLHSLRVISPSFSTALLQAIAGAAAAAGRVLPLLVMLQQPHEGAEAMQTVCRQVQSAAVRWELLDAEERPVHAIHWG
jgi:hypothetical protein